MKIKLIAPLVIMLVLSSCTQVIVDSADEVRMYRWSASLNNKSTVTLSFKNDEGCFRIKSGDRAANAVIKGLSVIDNKTIMIYNKAENEPYCFEYKIRNNKLVLSYDGGKITLNSQIDNTG